MKGLQGDVLRQNTLQPRRDFTEDVLKRRETVKTQVFPPLGDVFFSVWFGVKEAKGCVTVGGFGSDLV